MLSLFACFGISYVYRKTCSLKQVNRQVRTVVPAVVGIGIVFFCFGRLVIANNYEQALIMKLTKNALFFRAIKHLLANALGSYAIMYFAPPTQVHK